MVWLVGAAEMYRREMSERIGPDDDWISSYGGGDLDLVSAGLGGRGEGAWCLRVWAAGEKVHYLPAAEVDHLSQTVNKRRQFGR